MTNEQKITVEVVVDCGVAHAWHALAPCRRRCGEVPESPSHPASAIARIGRLDTMGWRTSAFGGSTL